MRLQPLGSTPGGTALASLPAAAAASASRAAARAPAWTSRQLALAMAATFAFWLAAALVWPLTDSVVPWDSKNHFYPMLRYLGAALANGELPLWNPYHFSGHPAVADPQALLFTPTMLLFGWLDASPSMQTFDLVVFAHLLPGALAILWLFRRRNWRPEGAVVAAFIFVLGGSASARLQHTGIIVGYGLYPLALLLLEIALERRSYRVGALFAVTAAMMVIGRDQVAFLSGVSLVGYCLYEAWGSGRPLAYLRDRLGLLAGMAAIGALLLAVPVILTAQLVGTSTRPAFSYGVAAMGSLPPESLVTILFANVFGSLRWTYDYWGPDWHSLVEGTWTDRATNYLFAGTLPALLIVWHGVAGGRLLAREFRFFALLGLVALLYALGRYTPAFAFLFDRLPGIALYRRPADATFQINIVLAFAAGYLVHRFLVDGLPDIGLRRAKPARIVLAALAAALVMGAIAAAFSFGIAGKHAAETAIAVGSGLLLAAGAAWLLVGSRRAPAWRQVAAVALVAATGAELIWRNAASALNAEPAGRYAVFTELPPEQMHGLHVLKAELAARHAKGDRPRVEILGLGGAWQNASMVLQLEDTIGYNPLRLADYERAIGPGENAADPNLRTFPGTFRGYRCGPLGTSGLDFVCESAPPDAVWYAPWRYGRWRWVNPAPPGG